MCQQVTANVDAAKSAKTAAEAATNATRIAQEQLKLSEMRYQASLRAAESAAESAAQASRLAQAEFKISKTRLRAGVHERQGGGGRRARLHLRAAQPKRLAGETRSVSMRPCSAPERLPPPQAVG
jgi:hypothetical protein